MATRQVTVSGVTVPTLGQGTWYLGDDPNRREQEIATLRRGIELGMTLVDTAEMYGSGSSEKLVGEAIKPFREDVFLVDKILPNNASAAGTAEACIRSLRALGTEWIDLYLLHWPGIHPLEETIESFHALLDRGLIRAWGVSNFDTDELAACPQPPQVNQILYNPSRRGPEFDLLPAMRREAIPCMAYSPIEQGRLLRDQTLALIASQHDATVAQVLLAWAIRSGDVIAIPKASQVQHVEANADAWGVALTAEDLADLDMAFPAPSRPMPLEVL